jgi:hypothetical protein
MKRRYKANSERYQELIDKYEVAQKIKSPVQWTILKSSIAKRYNIRVISISPLKSYLSVDSSKIPEEKNLFGFLDELIEKGVLKRTGS